MDVDKVGYFGQGSFEEWKKWWLEEVFAMDFGWKNGHYHMDSTCRDISLISIENNGIYIQSKDKSDSRYQAFKTFDDLIDNYIMHDGTPLREAIKHIDEHAGY